MGSQATCNLAIETSARQGEVAVGRGEQLLGVRAIPLPPRGVHHRVDLMLTIDELFREHGIAPADVGEVYVSVGPGSFTGLRNAVTTAKMLEMTLDTRIVAVPTTDVVVHNAPAECEHVAVCLNSKGDSVYVAEYRRGGDVWRAVGSPRTVDYGTLLAEAERPLCVLGDHLPKLSPPAKVTVLDASFAQPRAEVAWRLGRAMAKRGEFTDALNLLPLYARVPEAVSLWDSREKREEQRVKREE